MSLFNNLKGVEKDTPTQLVKRFIPGRDITYGDGSKDRIIEAIVYSNRVYVLVDQISVDGRSLSNQYKIYEALNEKGLELQKITEIDLLQNILPLFSDSKGKRVIDDFVKGMLGDSSPKEGTTVLVKDKKGFVINSEITKTESGVEWIDTAIGIPLGLLDLLAKWSYEAQNNYDTQPLPLSGILRISRSGPVNVMASYGYDIWMGINAYYDEAVRMWNYSKDSPHNSEYWKEFYEDLGVFEAHFGLNPPWAPDIAAIGWYNTPVYQCNSEADFRRFMIEFDKLLKKRYPNTDITVSIPKATSDTGCYIATAVYGSYDCPEVWTLRRYRDYKLAGTWYGRTFIHTYYAISPTLVKWFGDTKWFKEMWRGSLDRMVSNLQKKGYSSSPYEDRAW